MAGFDFVKGAMESQEKSASTNTTQIDVEPKLQDRTAGDEFSTKGNSNSFIGDMVESIAGPIARDPVAKRYDDAYRILSGSGSDSDKQKKLKNIFPESKFSFDGNQKTFQLGDEKFPIFEKGDEGYDEYNPPGILTSPLGNEHREFSNPKNQIRAIKQQVVQDQMVRGNKEVNPNDFVKLGRDSYGNALMILKKDALGYKAGKYYLNKPGLSRGDLKGILPGVRDVAPAVAASDAMIPAKALKAMGVVGGVTGVSTALQEGEKKLSGYESDFTKALTNAGYAALGEGVARTLIPAFTNLGRRIIGTKKAKVVDDQGDFSPEFKAALEDKGISEKELMEMYRSSLNKDELKLLNPDQVMRKGDFEAIGTQGSKGQITRDFKQMEMESRLAKDSDNGNDLRSLLDQQDQKLFDELNKVQRGTSGNPDFVEAGIKSKGALRADEIVQKKEANKLYESAKKATGNESRIKLSTFDENIKPVLDEFEGLVPASVIKRIKEFVNKDRDFTLKEAEKFIKNINAHTDPMKAAQNKALKEVRKVVDRAIESMGNRSGKAKELFKEGREVVTTRKQMFNNKDVVNKVVAEKRPLNDMVADEDVFKVMILNSSRADLRKSVKTLERTKEGTQAVKDMRASFVEHLKSKAKNSQGAEDITFSPTKFTKELDKYIANKKIYELYDKKVVDNLKLISRVAKSREFPRGAQNFSNTQSAINNAISQTLKVPGFQMLAPILKPIAAVFESQARKKVAKSATNPKTMTKRMVQDRKKEAKRTRKEEKKVQRGKDKKFVKKLGLQKVIPVLEGD